eukprot:2456936-Prymnesium_polylepis.2
MALASSPLAPVTSESRSPFSLASGSPFDKIGPISSTHVAPPPPPPWSPPAAPASPSPRSARLAIRASRLRNATARVVESSLPRGVLAFELLHALAFALTLTAEAAVPPGV